MKHKTLFRFAFSSFFLSAAANAANVGIVSNFDLTDAAMADTVTILEDGGHTVTWIDAPTIAGVLTDLYAGPGAEAGQTKKAYLESFDAIIIARTAGSGNFNDNAGWANLEVGVLSGNGYASRGDPSHLVWFSGTQGETGAAANPDTTVIITEHPIFEGVGTPANLWADPLLTGTALSAMTIRAAPSPPSYGGGTLIANATNGNHTIVTWNAGDTFPNGNVAAKRRVFFALLGRNGNPSGQTANASGMTEDGKTAFLNAIDWVLVDEEIPDTDGDGLPDVWELANFRESEEETEAEILAKWDGEDDPDGDGHNNLAEYEAGSDPNEAGSVPGDVDGDGLPDALEMQYFGNLAQGPNGDFDGDMVSNAAEIAAGTLPNNAANWPDADEDGINDAWEVLHGLNPADPTDAGLDPDGDGFSNLEEFLAGSDPGDSDWTPEHATLKHRWSFNNSLEDSAGDSDALIVTPETDPPTESNATLGENSVTLSGGAKGSSSYVKLGNNLLSSLYSERPVPVTIELWATQHSIQNWSRIFDFGTDYGTATDGTNPTANQSLAMSWTNGTDINTDRVLWNGGPLSDSTNRPYVLDTPIHVVMTIVPAMHSGGAIARGSVVTWYTSPAPTEGQPHPLYSSKGSFTTTNSLGNLLDGVALLGRSMYTGDSTANATYDEVRIWAGALTEEERKLFHLIGPDNIDRTDSDSDGFPDAWELAHFGNLTTATGAVDADADDDGFTDLAEYLAESNPNNPASIPDDVDADGLPDSTFERAYFRNLLQNPEDDPDGDGFDNAAEYEAESDPTSAASTPDSDSDGMPDGWEREHFGNLNQGANDNPDGDFDTNLEEYIGGFDPNDEFSGRDEDDDNLVDYWEFFYFSDLEEGQEPDQDDIDRIIALYDGNDDPDNDGATNAAEFAALTDPTDPNSFADTNFDGIADGYFLTATNGWSAGGDNAFTMAVNWSSGQAPIAASNYLVANGYEIRTPNTAATTTTFAGKLLAVSSSTLTLKGNGSTVSGNFLLDNAVLRNANDQVNSTSTVNGEILIFPREGEPNQATIFSADNGPLIVAATISGGSGLTIRGNVSAIRQVQIENPENTYSGKVVLEASASLILNGALDANAESVYSFAPGASGVSNTIGGTGAFVLKGIFDINLTAASPLGGSNWALVSNDAVTYDAAFSVADFTTEGGDPGSRIWISGDYEFSEATGILRNTGEVSGYTGWALSQGLTEANFGAETDVDGDSYANILEYQLNGNPLAFDGDLVGVTEDDNDLIFTFERSNLSELDSTLNFRWSTNLQTWNTVVIGAVSSGADANGVTVTVVEGGGSSTEFDQVTVRLPKSNGSAAGRLFAQLQGTQP